MNSNNHITVDQIKNDAEVIKKELVEWRHYLHAHPELSFKEERTTHYIVNKLKKFWIYRYSNWLWTIKNWSYG